MKGTWFCVTCRVDNGCRIETWRSVVYAVTATQAKRMVYEYWISRDSETTADILSVLKMSTNDIIHMETGSCDISSVTEVNSY